MNPCLYLVISLDTVTQTERMKGRVSLLITVGHISPGFQQHPGRLEVVHVVECCLAGGVRDIHI